MKTLILCLFGSLLIGWIFPWWSVFILGAIAGALFAKNGWAGFFFSFLGVFLAWAIVSFALDMRNEGILSNRMAEMFALPSGSLMVLISSFVGGIVGGVGGLLGALIRGDYFAKG